MAVVFEGELGLSGAGMAADFGASRGFKIPHFVEGDDFRPIFFLGMEAHEGGLGLCFVCRKVFALFLGEGRVSFGHREDGAEVGFGEVVLAEFGGGEAGVEIRLGAVFGGDGVVEEGFEGLDGEFEAIFFEVLIAKHELRPFEVGMVG